MERSDFTAPARRTVRVVARGLLARVRATRDRLDDPDDDEALHDFRVAGRRLRSWCRAWSAELGDTMREKDRERLGRVVHASGASRDLEVQIAWLRGQHRSARGLLRAGIAASVDELLARRAVADAALRDALDRDFDRATAALGAAFDEYTVCVDGSDERFGYAAARLTRAAAAELNSALRAVKSIADRTEAHGARIAGKRLRYLLEPVAEPLPAVKRVVERLSEIQDAFGELHDAQVLLGEAADREADAEAAGADAAGEADAASSDAPGMHQLRTRLRKRDRQAYAAAERRWLRGHAPELFADVEAVACALDDAARQGQEIERKYLLRELPQRLRGGRCDEIDQGYVPGDRVAERLRRVRPPRGEARYYRTVKAGAGLVRQEIEDETTAAVFAAMWPLTKGRRVKKRRYTRRAHGVEWVVDEFLDRELVVAEVELARPDDTPAMPAWIEAVLVREVTDDSAFTNFNLAR
jgi:CHAD domain-containing protein/CYTH domain-containing protein